MAADNPTPGDSHEHVSGKITPLRKKKCAPIPDGWKTIEEIAVLAKVPQYRVRKAIAYLEVNPTRYPDRRMRYDEETVRQIAKHIVDYIQNHSHGHKNMMQVVPDVAPAINNAETAGKQIS